MTVDQRVQKLRVRMKKIGSDEARYAISEKLRELGYIDFTDFCVADPRVVHIAEIEGLLEHRGW